MRVSSKEYDPSFLKEIYIKLKMVISRSFVLTKKVEIVGVLQILQK